MTRRPGARAYTIEPTAPRAAINAASRGALVALRPVLRTLDIDLVVDGEWPDNAEPALAVLERKRRKRWIRRTQPPSMTADADPANDADFEAAVIIAPYSICATGITAEGHDAYNADDSGYSQRFLLTDDELATTTAFIVAQNQDPACLIPARP